MSKTTTIHGLPYPEDADSPDGPAQIKALAEALDALKYGSRSLKPTALVAGASGTLSLTEAFQDVSGMVIEVAPAVASILLVTAVFDLESIVGKAEWSGDSFQAEAYGTVKLNSGADQTRQATLLHIQSGKINPSSGLGGADGAYTLRGTFSQTYALALTAGSHTVKGRAKRNGNGKGNCKSNSSLSGLLFAT